MPPVSLILTHKNGFEPDLVIDILRERGVAFARFNFDDFPAEKHVSLAIDGHNFTGIIDLGKRLIQLNEIDVVWFHESPLFSFPVALLNEPVYTIALNETEAFINGIWEFLIDRPWINHPISLQRASNKIYQLKVAQEVGLLSPSTIITNDPKQAKDFLMKNGGIALLKDLNYKPTLISGRLLGSFSKRISMDDIQDESRIQCVPIQLQKYIDKQYELRITIVGDSVFPAALDSQAYEISTVDWRRYDLDEPMNCWVAELPEDVRLKCLSMMKVLNLRYGAIDMIVTPDGQYYFLEINTTGAWGWLEGKLGLPISEAFADLIIRLKS